MDAETLILETFVDETFFTAPCVPDARLYLDLPYIEEEESTSVYAEAFSNFLKLTPDDLRKVTPYAFAMFKQFETAVDPSCLNVTVEEEEGGWSEVSVEGVNLIRNKSYEDTVYVQLSVECTWDPEHGMQFIYRNGNVLSRVSANDGEYFLVDLPALPTK